MDLISIIIPVYNAEKSIEKCLNSVLASCDRGKKSFNSEVVAINDGSTDRSLEILESFAKKDSRVKVITHANQGAAASRQRGIDNAKGNIIAWCDSDDWVEPDWLSARYDAMVQTGADMALCSAIIGDAQPPAPGEIEVWDKKKTIELFVQHKRLNGSLCVKMQYCPK